MSLGDRADVSRRACGCPLETLGWRTHLATVRSFEKLTAGGVTFVDGALIRVLEETLPARFGGGPLDYQLVEEEGADGLPRVRLMVADRVGAVDTTRVMDTFRQALLQQSRSSALLWQQGRWLEVERGERGRDGQGQGPPPRAPRTEGRSGRRACDRGRRVTADRRGELVDLFQDRRAGTLASQSR